MAGTEKIKIFLQLIHKKFFILVTLLESLRFDHLITQRHLSAKHTAATSSI